MALVPPLLGRATRADGHERRATRTPPIRPGRDEDEESRPPSKIRGGLGVASTPASGPTAFPVLMDGNRSW